MATTPVTNSTLSTITSLGSNITTTVLQMTEIQRRDAEAIDTLDLSSKIVIGILLLVGTVSGVFGNILVLFAILLNKILRNQIPNLMILNLAVTDLIMTAFVMPILGAYFVFDWPDWKFGDALCTTTAYVLNVVGLVSVLTMAFIAFDRYFAVMRNKLMLKRRNVKIVLCILWVISAAALLYPVFSGGVAKSRFKNGEYNVCNRMSGKLIFDTSFRGSLILKLVFGVFVLVSLLMMYARMGYSIWTVRKAPTDQDRKSKAVKKADSNKTRAIKLMFSIVLVFVICWIPYWVATFLLIVPVPSDNLNIDPAFVLISYSFAMLNSSVNPTLYALLSRKFRTAYRNVLGRARNRFSTTFHSSDYRMSTRSGRKGTVSTDSGMSVRSQQKSTISTGAVNVV